MNKIKLIVSLCYETGVDHGNLHEERIIETSLTQEELINKQEKMASIIEKELSLTCDCSGGNQFKDSVEEFELQCVDPVDNQAIAKSYMSDIMNDFINEMQGDK